MVNRRQVLTMIGIATMSFILGTMLSGNLMALSSDEYGIPFAKIWEAVYNLQGRVENIEEQMNGTSGVDFEAFINEISRVELQRVGSYDGAPYTYYYGVSGLWNVTKLQTEPFTEKLNSTIGGALINWDTYFLSLKYPEYKGYERQVWMAVDRELNPTEIEEVRLLIKEYLAHL